MPDGDTQFTVGQEVTLARPHVVHGRFYIPDYMFGTNFTITGYRLNAGEHYYEARCHRGRMGWSIWHSMLDPVGGPW